MKVKGYYVVVGDSLSILMNEVNIWISKGWQPLGGIGIEIRTESNWATFYQAIVRY